MRRGKSYALQRLNRSDRVDRGIREKSFTVNHRIMNGGQSEGILVSLPSFLLSLTADKSSMSHLAFIDKAFQERRTRSFATNTHSRYL